MEHATKGADVAIATDWALVRELMNTAIDACEAAERLQLSEGDRSLPTGTDRVVVWEVLTSAWTYPENLQYAVIRARHRLEDDVPYRLEFARVLRQVGAVCGELVGASRLDESVPAGGRIGDTRSIRKMVKGLVTWYQEQMVPQLTQAAASRSVAKD